MSYQLYEHQKHILELLTAHPQFMLLAEVGTGKTLPVLIHISNLLLSGEIDDALVVAPLSGLGAWRRDTAKLSPERRKLIDEKVTFINYDKLSRKNSKHQRACWRSWGAIVLDEGHAIANPSANRTRFFVGRGTSLGLNAMSTYRYLLTGTLITNSRLEDLWGPLRFILADEWMSWSAFKRRYLVVKTLPGSYAELVVGYRNRAELLETVGRHAYRVLKKDCLDLPPRLPDEVISVPWAPGANEPPIGKSTRELYQDTLDSYIAGLDIVVDNPLTQALRLRQIAAGHIKEADAVARDGTMIRGAVYPLNTLKIKYAMELITSALPKKTVVFHHFRYSGSALAHELDKSGIPYVVLNGVNPDKESWVRFQKDENIKVIIVQYQSGAQSIDLFASSRTIYLEPTVSSALLDQSRARTDRSGQTEPCEYIFLLTEDSIEEEIYRRLERHEDFSEQAYREMLEARRKRVGGDGRG